MISNLNKAKFFEIPRSSHTKSIELLLKAHSMKVKAKSECLPIFLLLIPMMVD